MYIAIASSSLDVDNKLTI